MKNFRKFMIAAAVCLSAAPFLTSCEDDAPETPMPIDGSVAGTYKLTSYGINEEDSANPGTWIPSVADLNGDGTESHDLTAESSCYGEGYIRLNSNHTYTRVYSFSDGAGACTTATREAGVWSRVDNVITISSSDTNGEENGTGMDVYTMDFTWSESGTLSGSREDVNTFEGVGFGTSKVDYGYTKVEE